MDAIRSTHRSSPVRVPRHRDHRFHAIGDHPVRDGSQLPPNTDRTGRPFSIPRSSRAARPGAQRRLFPPTPLRKERMATERLTMRALREILRQKLQLGRSHREAARAAGVGPGSVASAATRARALCP
jgi:DNA-directed RNA polymerase specialized sigma24 family protein